MSNPYVNINDLVARVDKRWVFQLSNDANATQADIDNVNTILDDAASEFESSVDQRYSLGTVQSTSPMPNIIKRYICDRAILELSMRRGKVPKEVEAQIKLDDIWMDKIQKGISNLPGIGRSPGPMLVTSSRPDGSSRFDYDFGQIPSPAGPTQGGPSQPQGINPGGPFPRNLD